MAPPAFHHQRDVLAITGEAIDLLKRITRRDKKFPVAKRLDASRPALHAKDLCGGGGRTLEGLLSA